LSREQHLPTVRPGRAPQKDDGLRRLPIRTAETRQAALVRGLIAEGGPGGGRLSGGAG